MKATEKSDFLASMGSRGVVWSLGQHHLQHPALGGFGPLTQSLLSPRPFLYLWTYTPVIEILHQKPSVYLLKMFPSNLELLPFFFFQGITPPLHHLDAEYHILAQSEIHFLFSLTENKYQKVLYLLSNLFLLALYNDIF